MTPNYYKKRYNASASYRFSYTISKSGKVYFNTVPMSTPIGRSAIAIKSSSPDSSTRVAYSPSILAIL